MSTTNLGYHDLLEKDGWNLSSNFLKIKLSPHSKIGEIQKSEYRSLIRLAYNKYVADYAGDSFGDVVPDSDTVNKEIDNLSEHQKKLVCSTFEEFVPTNPILVKLATMIMIDIHTIPEYIKMMDCHDLDPSPTISTFKSDFMEFMGYHHQIDKDFNYYNPEIQTFVCMNDDGVFIGLYNIRYGMFPKNLPNWYAEDDHIHITKTNQLFHHLYDTVQLIKVVDSEKIDQNISNKALLEYFKYAVEFGDRFIRFPNIDGKLLPNLKDIDDPKRDVVRIRKNIANSDLWKHKYENFVNMVQAKNSLQAAYLLDYANKLSEFILKDDKLDCDYLWQSFRSKVSKTIKKLDL